MLGQTCSLKEYAFYKENNLQAVIKSIQQTGLSSAVIHFVYLQSKYKIVVLIIIS